MKLCHGRSLEGTLTFAAVGTTVCIVALSVFYPTVGLTTALALSAGAAVSGAIAELVSRRIDDNFSVPVAAVAGVMAVMSLGF